MKLDLFKDKTFLKKLTSLTLPIAFQSFMLASVAAGDAVMLGRVEQNSMSAVSLATQIQFIQNMVLGTVNGDIVLVRHILKNSDGTCVGFCFDVLNNLFSFVF